jgi:hypothetical protein
MSKVRLTGLMTLACVGLVGGPVRADRRGYVWTYEYMTMPQGEFELEYYLTAKVPDAGNFGGRNTWQHQAELEYGITDRWDVAVYQRWQQTNTTTEDTFEYTGTKLRMRYRLGEKGMYPVDTLFYLEYIRPDSSHEPEFLEGKLVLSKDIGKFNVAYNQIFETAISHERETEHEYALGVSYEFNPRWRVALESTGSFTEGSYSLGPTISWAGQHLWLAAGVLAGLNDKSDDLNFRLIVGIPF